VCLKVGITVRHTLFFISKSGRREGLNQDTKESVSDTSEGHLRYREAQTQL